MQVSWFALRYLDIQNKKAMSCVVFRQSCSTTWPVLSMSCAKRLIASFALLTWRRPTSVPRSVLPFQLRLRRRSVRRWWCTHLVDRCHRLKSLVTLLLAAVMVMSVALLETLSAATWSAWLVEHTSFIDSLDLFNEPISDLLKLSDFIIAFHFNTLQIYRHLHQKVWKRLANSGWLSDAVR